MEDKLKELINKEEENGGKLKLPCIATRGVTVFPGKSENFNMSRRRSIFSAKKALAEDSYVFIVAQKEDSVERPTLSDLYEVGTVCEILQLVETAGEVVRCVVGGISRARMLNYNTRGNGSTAEIEILENYEPDNASELEIEALKRELKNAYYEYSIAVAMTAKEVEFTYEDVFVTESAKTLYEQIALTLDMQNKDRQALLELGTLKDRMNCLLNIITAETEIIRLEAKIGEQVHEAVSRNQKEFYIREQIAALQNELEGSNLNGEENMFSQGTDVLRYEKLVNEIKNIDEESRQKLLEEVSHLAHTPNYTQESAAMRSYLDTVLTLPWDKKSDECLDLELASKILEKDHYGLQKVKDRILENIAVRALTPDVKGQIICLYGPPGVGKTSIAKSIARAMNRKYVRVSLGGVRDEADIRGHRRTYLGSMPGRIITALRQVKVNNPVMLLDEIDKLTHDMRGDPASALLEVLDSEQNVAFRDHYTEVPFDLSNVLFITTANDISTIDPPLLDRMEIIELSSYTREEKFMIARKYLVPKQLKKYGIKASQLKFADSTLYALIDSYTREAGVRKLEQRIASLCRKAARKLVEGESKVNLKAGDLQDYLGHKRHTDDFYVREPLVGSVNGLAWTAVGGVIMPLEVLVLEGKGKLQLTGSLGDVMKESAQLAISTARRLADKYNIAPDFYEKTDMHMHAPEAATPKDGPSAGVTMTTAVISALSGIKVRSDVAMTGEITLTGKVLPIGGLREKAMAAYKAGIKTVIIPADNEPDLDEVDDIVKENVKFIFADRIEDVLDNALITGEEKPAPVPEEPPRRRRGRPRKNPKPATVLATESETEAGV